jgi:DNA-directed RNA polymerase specialized sigma subunit
MGILNIEEYKRRLKSGNPVTIEELENELKVLIKEMIEAATQGEITDYLGYEKNKKLDSENYRNGYSTKNLKSKYETVPKCQDQYILKFNILHNLSNFFAIFISFSV